MYLSEIKFGLNLIRRKNYIYIVIRNSIQTLSERYNVFFMRYRLWYFTNIKFKHQVAKSFNN